MTNSKTTRKALLSSVLALTLCVAMLIATTFAWFTDTASTSVNKIQAGTLDVELWQADVDEKLSSTALKWVKADEHAEEAVLWEPGCTYNLESFRIKNNGNLALKYKVIISGIVGDAKLLEAIDFTVKIGDADPVALANWDGTLAKEAVTDKITITGTMKTTAGNEYQGLSIEGIGITVVATQLNSEYDSTNNTYDKDAVLPVAASAKGNLNLTTDSETGSARVLAEQTLSDNVMKVTYPANVLLKSNITVDGTTDKKATVEQKLEYVDDAPSEKMSSVTIGADKAVASYELTLPVADTNTTLVTATINYAKGLTGVQIYHTGVLLATSAASDNESAREYAEYNSETGVITLHLFKASPIDIVYDKEPGVTTVNTQNELNAAIADDDIKTIKLGKAWNGNMLVNGANDVTLDFNGYTVDGTMYVGCNEDDWGNKAYTGTSSTLTLKDSKGTGGVKTSNMTAIYLMNSSNLTIENGTYETTGYGYTGYSHTIYMTNCNLTVNGGYIHNNAAGGSYNKVIVCDYDKGAASITINGGKFEGTKACTYTEPYLGITLQGGTYSVIIGADSSTNTNVPVTINGGEFYSYTWCSFLTDVKGNVLVNDCTFVHDDAGKNYGNRVFDINSGFTVTVTNGKFTVNGEDYTNSSWKK